MVFKLKVDKREGKVKEEELCMGVVSSAKMDSVPLKFDKKDFIKLYRDAGQNSIIVLEGLDKPVEVTIQHVDRTSLTNEVHHVDFHALEKGAEMDAEVPLKLINEAPAVKQEAVINQPVHTISITCKPKDLIQEIEVDMSLLKEIGDAIHVKDLNVPSSIKINLDPETVVVSASLPKPEKEEEEEENKDEEETENEAENTENAEAEEEGKENKE